MRSTWQMSLVVAAFVAVLGATMLPALLTEGKWPYDSWSGGYAVYAWMVAALVAFCAGLTVIDDWMRRHAVAGHVVIFMVCGLAAFIALRQNLDARFGGVDDHEIAYWLGPDKRCHWREWPSLWWQGEVSSFGADGRYRPGYSALRIAECCLWEKSVPAWYASRIAMCATFLAFLWLLLRRWWGDCMAFAFTMAVLGLPALGDVYCRLGPAETHALPAMMIGIWGLSVAWFGADNQTVCKASWPWWVVSLGFGIAVLCKENFAPWAALAWICGILWLWRTRGAGRRGSAYAALALLAVWMGLVGCAVVRGVLTIQGDVYGNNVGSSTLVSSAQHALSQLLFAGPLLGLLPLLVLAAACRLLSPSMIRPARWIAWSAAILWLWLSQALFYRSPLWLAGTRYDLPSALIPLALMILCMLWMLDRLRDRYPFAAWQTYRGAVFALLLVLAGQNIVVHTMSRAKVNRDVTRGYASWLGGIVKETRSNPNAVVLLLPERAADHYEYLMAALRFLRYQGVSNPIKYSTRYLQPPTWPLDEKLNKDLHEKAPAALPENAGEGLLADAILIPFGDIAHADLIARGERTMERSLDKALYPKSSKQ